MIYPIFFDDEQQLKSYGLPPAPQVYGVAISFPGSDTTIQVEYEVNAVYSDAEN